MRFSSEEESQLRLKKSIVNKVKYLQTKENNLNLQKLKSKYNHINYE